MSSRGSRKHKASLGFYDKDSANSRIIVVLEKTLLPNPCGDYPLFTIKDNCGPRETVGTRKCRRSFREATGCSSFHQH